MALRKKTLVTLKSPATVNTKHIPLLSEGELQPQSSTSASEERKGARTGGLPWGAIVLLWRNSPKPRDLFLFFLSNEGILEVKLHKFG